MPNWITNHLYVSGEPQRIKEFTDMLFKKEEQEVTFNNFVPQPQNIFNGNLGRKEREMCEEKGIPNWYDWNISNWGVKWDASYTDIYHINDDEIHIRFETPWDGARPVYQKMSELFPDLQIKVEFNCESMEWAHRFENGVFSEAVIKYIFDDRDVILDNKDYTFKYIDTGEEVDDEEFYDYRSIVALFEDGDEIELC